MEEKLRELTRRQRAIFEAHVPLFEAIFNHPRLSHFDLDVLEYIQNEQLDHLIYELKASNTKHYREMTIKGTQKEVKEAIDNNLEELVEVVVNIIKDLGKEGRA